MKHIGTWKGWYYVPTSALADALRDAREQARRDHPDTPTDAMMTPNIRHVAAGVRVLVVGRPA